MISLSYALPYCKIALLKVPSPAQSFANVKTKALLASLAYRLADIKTEALIPARDGSLGNDLLCEFDRHVYW